MKEKHEWLTVKKGRLVVPHDFTVQVAGEKTPFLALVNMEGDVLVECKQLYGEKDIPFEMSLDLSSNDSAVSKLLVGFIEKIDSLFTGKFGSTKSKKMKESFYSLDTTLKRRKFISSLIRDMKSSIGEKEVDLIVNEINRSFILKSPFFNSYVFEMLERKSLEAYLEEKEKKKMSQPV